MWQGSDQEDAVKTVTILATDIDGDGNTALEANGEVRDE